MQHLQLSDEDVEQLLAGAQPQGRSDYADVALLLRQLRAQGGRAQVPPMSARMLAELDKAEAAAAETRRARREATRRKADLAHRRWRLMGAAAMVAMLVGIVAAHAHGVFSSSPASHSTDAGSSSDDDAAADEPRDRSDDVVVAPETVPPTVVTTLPPPTDPPATDPPATAGEAEGRGDRDGDDDRDRYDDDWWDDDWWDREVDEDGYIVYDPDGPGGREPMRFDPDWSRECHGDQGCIWDKWFEANQVSPTDGPDVYSSGP